MTALRKIVSASGDSVNTDAGPAPMLQWVEIDQLVIDDSYQRPLSSHNWKNIRQIAEGFKWSRFSPVLCAPVEGGLFAVIDGQHRAHAAAICGYKSVPCQIVQMSPVEQAASFAAVNGNVTKVTALNLLKAALAAGEPWAVECNAIASEAGCRLMLSNPSSKDRKPGQIYAARMFRKLVETRPRDAIIKSLTILMQAEGHRDNPDLWDGSILEPTLLAMTETPEHLDGEGFVSFIELYDIWEAIDGIENENKRRVGNGQPKISRKEGIRIDLMKAITEAMGEDAQ